MLIVTLGKKIAKIYLGSKTISHNADLMEGLKTVKVINK